MGSKEFEPPGIPEHLTPQEKQDFLEIHGLAHNLKYKTGGSYLYAASSLTGTSFSPEAFVVYLEQLLEESGHPTDPIERMLIEQIAMAHHNIGRLHVKTSTAETLDQVKVYSNAASGLLGEFRRAVLALKKYREPTPAKNFMLVKQQNVAQNQQVAFVDSDGEIETEPPEGHSEKKPPNSKLVSNGAIEHAQKTNLNPKPQPRSCGKEELVEAKRP